ncbi:MAG: glycosyltransferase, partial [Candidatus Thorarchaeota archaeon]
RWEVIKGNDQFYSITKSIHNAIHGNEVNFFDEHIQSYQEAQEANRDIVDNRFDDSDTILIHDPQPLGLIQFKSPNNNQNWVWRCHVDASNPYRPVWTFLANYVNMYKEAIFSTEEFTQHLTIPQVIVPPSIDPLSDKNINLSDDQIEKILKDYDIPENKKIITQISRFDRLKDPIGVIKAFKLAKEHLDDVHLILAGGGATDDPEGIEVFNEVNKEAENDPDISLLLLPQDNLLINALQRKSDIIIQKSIKEGFGLTISEALWKQKPVIATNVGGIKTQIIHNMTGVLVHGVKGTAIQIQKLVNNPTFAETLGRNGKEYVRNKFLITRHLLDYLMLIAAQHHNGSHRIGDRIYKYRYNNM